MADRHPTRAGASPAEDRAVLMRYVERTRSFGRGDEILRMGQVPNKAHILLEGHTCRQRTLRNGRRQITAVLVPGDMCDVEAVVNGRADYDVRALTACTLGEISLATVTGAAFEAPELAAVLLRRLRQDEAIGREWIVNLGQRVGKARLAHFFCEWATRLEGLGLANGTEGLPQLGQADLANALGMSSVHISRMMTALRRTGLITTGNGRLVIKDRAALERLVDFDPRYLFPN